MKRFCVFFFSLPEPFSLRNICRVSDFLYDSEKRGRKNFNANRADVGEAGRQSRPKSKRRGQKGIVRADLPYLDVKRRFLRLDLDLWIFNGGINANEVLKHKEGTWRMKWFKEV